MKQKSLPGKLVYNFYLRNTAILLLLLCASTLDKIALGYFVLSGFLYHCFSFSFFYLLFVFHNRVLYPQLWQRKKRLLYILGTFLSVAVFQYVFVEKAKLLFGQPQEPTPALYWVALLLNDFIYVYMSWGIFQAFNYFKQREEQLNIEYLKRELELKQLKAQLNPHFIFNALNNIYSYTIEEKNTSGELILKLSDLLRHILTISQKDEIQLQEELQFIDNYLVFERERLGSRCNITFRRQIADPRLSIAPFILFIFIENAIKHGTIAISHSDINIAIEQNHESLQLYISNPVHQNNKKTSTNIGLINIQRRLDLLYPNRYKLQLITDDDTFITSLELTTIK